MALIIGGHPRSGTTMLERLCNSHPALRITREFHSFMRLEVTYRRYVRRLRKTWYRGSIVPRTVPHPRVRSLVFLVRYLIELRGCRSALIGAREVEAVRLPDMTREGGRRLWQTHMAQITRCRHGSSS